MLSVSVFRDAITKLSLRKKLTMLAAVGLFLPILVLTYMQYRSLAELQSKTKGAFKDNMRQGFVVVEQQMKKRLEEIAAQTLSPVGNMPLSSSNALEKYFADVKRSHPEIHQIFVSTTAEADIMSLFNSARMSQSFVDGNRKYLFVHSSMRQQAYLFYPLPDLQKDSGFAGVLLREGFVSNDLLPGSIAKTISMYHGTNADSSDVAFTVSDENNEVLFSNAPAQNGYFLEANFDPPFSNWTAKVGLKNTNLDQLARRSFLQSAGVTLLVLVFLLCGMVLIIRATDREARLAQAKSNFVSNVSHELKTPLSLLSLFSEILELGRVNSEEKKTEYYRIIRHESLRLNKMIDNVLDFSKIEAGRKSYVFVSSHMAEVMENVLSNYRYQISNSGFKIQTNIQPGMPPVVIDRDAMAQAISNLIDNAMKYSRDLKQLTITASTSGANLSIEVADHGIGISRTEHARIFEKFYRVGDGLVHDVKGSGLGLSLVKHIVEAHRGTISVESDVGKGSRFTILLPLGEP